MIEHNQDENLVEWAVGTDLASAMGEGFCRREELWITSKLWNTYHEPRHVRCRRAFASRFETRRARFVSRALPNQPGVCPLRRVLSARLVPRPASARPRHEAHSGTVGGDVGCDGGTGASRAGQADRGVQLRDVIATRSLGIRSDPPGGSPGRNAPLSYQERLLRYCREERIAVTAFSPFGADSYLPLGMAGPGESVLEDPIVTAIVHHRGRTPARSRSVGPFRRHSGDTEDPQPVRLKENLAVFDFGPWRRRDAEPFRANRNRRFNDPGEFCEKAFDTFFPIFD